MARLFVEIHITRFAAASSCRKTMKFHGSSPLVTWIAFCLFIVLQMLAEMTNSESRCFTMLMVPLTHQKNSNTTTTNWHRGRHCKHYHVKFAQIYDPPDSPIGHTMTGTGAPAAEHLTLRVKCKHAMMSRFDCACLFTNQTTDSGSSLKLMNRVRTAFKNQKAILVLVWPNSWFRITHTSSDTIEKRPCKPFVDPQNVTGTHNLYNVTISNCDDAERDGIRPSQFSTKEVISCSYLTIACAIQKDSHKGVHNLSCSNGIPVRLFTISESVGDPCVTTGIKANGQLETRCRTDVVQSHTLATDYRGAEKETYLQNKNAPGEQWRETSRNSKHVLLKDVFNISVPSSLAVRRFRSVIDNQLTTSRVPRTAVRFPHSPSSLKYTITFRNAESYLIVPALRLYDRFSLRFALRTTQSDGLVLFNSGPFGVDFIAFELAQGHLFVNFDMGSGAQRHGLIGARLDDNHWHYVELIREDTDQNKLRFCIDPGGKSELRIDIQVLHGELSKNFNLADVLYLGGIPKFLQLKWRERLHVLHGFQGCFGNFSVNNQSAIDLIKQSQELSKNRSISEHLFTEDVVTGCFDRPTGALACPRNVGAYRLHEAGANQTLPRGTHDAYCMNDGLCLLMWSTVKCSCELTSFQGSRCSQTGTTIKFGIDASSRSAKINKDASIGYLRLTYTDRVRNTHQEEFVLGLQSFPMRNRTDIAANPIKTLIFVTNSAQNGDYLHLYLHSGLVRLDCDFGGGPIRIVGPTIRLDDGYYHRIRGFRLDFRLMLEIDQVQTVYILKGRYGKQFNGQETIWLGHAPNLNRTDFFQGFMSGVYYNGILLTDVAAGLYYLPFMHVTRYADVEHVNNFEAALSPGSPFRSRTEQRDRQLFKDLNHSLLFAADSASTTNTQADAQSPIERNQLAFDKHQRTSNHIPTEFSTEPKQDEKLIDSTRSTTKSSINDQVNIWLLVCLAGAGCIMLSSLTVLAYRFHFKRMACCNRTRRRDMHANKSSPSIHRTDCAQNAVIHGAPSFHDVLACGSPILLPLSGSAARTRTSQLEISAGSIPAGIPSSSISPALAVMMPSPMLAEANVKTSRTIAAACCPVHSHAVPTSVIYLDRPNIVPTALYQPWEHSSGVVNRNNNHNDQNISDNKNNVITISTDQNSSIGMHSTSSSPIIDCIKPVLSTEVRDKLFVATADVCDRFHTNNSFTDAP